jgi:hypothetical protein
MITPRKLLAATVAALLPLVAWAGLTTQTISASPTATDTTPNGFTFTDQTNVALASTITSAAVTITGISSPTLCTATNGTVDKNSSGTFASSQTVANNETIRARHTSSVSNSTAVNTPVSCGGVSDTFTSTTEAGGGGAGDWADLFVTNVTTASNWSPLGTPGQSVGVEVGSTFTGLGQQLTSGNGATMDIVIGGSFDGLENAVRIYPPTACIGGPCDDLHNAEYAAWLRNLNLWNNGTINIAQINVRWLQYFGSTYYSNAPTAKIGGVFAQDVLTATPDAGSLRQAIWETQDTLNWTPYKYWGTTSTSIMYLPGFFIDSQPDTAKLMQIGPSPSHSNNPPRVGGEWVCFEQVVDLRQNRGNANGMNKLMLSTRDGVVAGRFIQSDANWGDNWDFSHIYVDGWEGLGFYYNKAGTADVNNYTMFSHVTFAANMAINETIGCENIPGFLQ